jgi:hypothetical protein
LRLAQLVVDRGWTYAAAAKMFMVAARTAKKWADRYRAQGACGMLDRSSRPHRSPTKTTPSTVRCIVKLRWRKRLGPVQIAGQLDMAASTVHAVLTRCWINRLSHIDRITGEPLRRYEHRAPMRPALLAAAGRRWYRPDRWRNEQAWRRWGFDALNHDQSGRPRGASVDGAPVGAVVVGHTVARRLDRRHGVDRPATRAVVGTQIGLVGIRVGVDCRRGQQGGGNQRSGHNVLHARHPISLPSPSR